MADLDGVTLSEVRRLRRLETYFERVIRAVDMPGSDVVAESAAAVAAYRTEGGGKWAACQWRTVDIVFDGPPGSESPRFVEVEDRNGCSTKAGEWIERSDGYWAIRLNTWGK